MSQGELLQATQVTPHVVVESFVADGMVRTYFRCHSSRPETPVEQANLALSPVIIPGNIVDAGALHETVVANVLAGRGIWDDVIDAEQAGTWFQEALDWTFTNLKSGGSNKRHVVEADQWDNFVQTLQLTLGPRWTVSAIAGEGGQDLVVWYRQAWTCLMQFDADRVARTDVYRFGPS